MTERPYKGNSLFFFPRDYISIDIETTGLAPSTCEILEISAVKYRDFEETDSFSTLIKPSAPIPYFITQLTGINDRMVENAPDIGSAIAAFGRFIGGDVLLGYNVHFDINFLYDAMLARIGVPLTNDFVDVLRFARRALPFLPNRSLGTVARHYGVSYAGAHRALADCRICHECYLKLMNESAFQKRA